MNGRLAVVAVLALTLTLSACGGGNEPTSATISTSRLEVVSWWTSSSEAKALGVLFAAFRDSNPGVHAINGAIRGGAGANAIVALAKRLQRNDPPDVWQTFAGNRSRPTRATAWSAASPRSSRVSTCERR